MVKVMKILATSFKMSHARTATFSAPDPAAGHQRPMPPPETPGHSRASLCQSLEGLLLLSPGSWCAQELMLLNCGVGEDFLESLGLQRDPTSQF